jgi:hypothetical protein
MYRLRRYIEYWVFIQAESDVLTCIKGGTIKGSKWKKNCMLNRKGENPNITFSKP